MGQAEMLEFLMKHEGEFFTIVQFQKEFDLSENAVRVIASKLIQWSRVTRVRRFVINGNISYYGYDTIRSDDEVIESLYK